MIKDFFILWIAYSLIIGAFVAVDIAEDLDTVCAEKQEKTELAELSFIKKVVFAPILVIAPTWNNPCDGYELKTNQIKNG